MGCGTFIAALLALAIPASIAPASAVGAFACLAVLVLAAVVVARRNRRALVRIATLAAVYAVVIGVIAVAA